MDTKGTKKPHWDPVPNSSRSLCWLWKIWDIEHQTKLP